MGQCSHFVTQVPVREKLNVQQTITKAIYLKGNNQILIEFADNTASNVQLNHAGFCSYEGLYFEHCVSKDTFLSLDNRVVQVKVIDSLQSPLFKQLALRCFQLKKANRLISLQTRPQYSSDGFVLPEEQYLRRNGNNYCLVLISRSMTAKSGTSRMVSLSILASYMVSAKMQWEDTEMAGIILRTMRVVNQASKICCLGLADVLVSSNAVFVLGDITHVGESNSADLSSVSSYFTKILADQRAPQESVNSYLHDKYWRCHKMLSKSLDWGSLCEEKGIVANHIDKYIASYLEYVDSMGSLSNDSIVQLYSLFGNRIAVDRVMRERVVAAIAEDRIGTVLLDCYVKLIENKEGAAGNCLSQASNNCLSQEYSPMHMTTTPRQSLSGKKLSMSETLQSQVLPVQSPWDEQNLRLQLETSCLQFARKEKKEGNYSSAKHWLEKVSSMCDSSDVLLQLSSIHVIFCEYEAAEKLIHKVLQKQLTQVNLQQVLKVTIEANLELAVQLLSTHEKLVEEEYKYEYFAGKIMFMKAVQIRSSKQRCLRQVTGNQPKLAQSYPSSDKESSQKYFNQAISLLETAVNRKISDQQYLICVLQCLGDLELYRESLVLAEQYYSKAKLVYMTLPSDNLVPKENYASVLASLANIQFLRENYVHSLSYYGEALRFVSDENPNLKNYVIGNMGLVQIYSGSTEEGKETLEYVLGRVTEKQQTENVDYKFFKEELERVKKIVLPSLK